MFLFIKSRKQAKDCIKGVLFNIIYQCRRMPSGRVTFSGCSVR